MKYYAKTEATETHTDVEFYRSDAHAKHGPTIWQIRVFKAWSAEFGSVNVCRVYIDKAIFNNLDTFEEISEEQFTNYAHLYEDFLEVQKIMDRNEAQIESLFA